MGTLTTPRGAIPGGVRTGDAPSSTAREANGQQQEVTPLEIPVPPGVDPAEAVPRPTRPTGVDEYDDAIEKKAVSLDHLVDALERKRAGKDDEQSRAHYARCFVELKSAYRKQESVEESYFCQNIAGGAVLTAARDRTSSLASVPGSPQGDQCAGPLRRGIRWLRGCRQHVRHDIHVRYPTSSVLAVTPDFAGVMWRCLALSKQAAQLLRTKNSVAVHRTTYSIIVYLLSVLDTVDSADSDPATEKDRKHRIQSAIEDAREQLRNARRQFEASARWGSRYAYTNGMVFGVFALTSVAAAAFWLLPSRSALVQTLVAVVATGAMGAAVSVMTRMSSNSFYLDPLAEHKALWILGAFRPCIGALFGVAMFLIVEGGMLDLIPQSVEAAGPSKRLLFFSALAFVAGFSERFAKGVITAAEGNGQGATGTGREARSTPRRAALA